MSSIEDGDVDDASSTPDDTIKPSLQVGELYSVLIATRVPSLGPWKTLTGNLLLMLSRFSLLQNSVGSVVATATPTEDSIGAYISAGVEPSTYAVVERNLPVFLLKVDDYWL